MPVTRVRVRVQGRVQGVYYRASAHERAAELGVAGWVRNEGDGSVIIEAEAERETVDRFIRWCRQGPTMARVTEVTVEQLEPAGARGFEIRH
jgi:acylphosphatase